MFKKQKVVAAALLTVVNVSTHATNIDETIVTATRFQQKIGSSLSAVTVISSEQITKMNATDILDILKQTPGIQVARNGGLGSLSNIFIRGTNSGHALFVVDGIRIDSTTSDTANFQHIDPESIERIEIVRGASSSVWGSDAIGGVIQIFTKKGSQPFNRQLTVGYGSNNQHSLNGNVSTGNSKSRLSISASHTQTDGIDNLNSDDAHTGILKIDNDDDPYRRSSFAINTEINISDNIAIYFTSNRSVGENEFDETKFEYSYDPVTDSYVPTNPILSRPYNEFEFFASSLTVEAQLANRLLTRVSIGRAIDDGVTRNDVGPDMPSKIKTKRNSINWQTNYSYSARSIITSGVDFIDDRVAGDIDYTENSRENIAGYFQHQLSSDQFNISSGVRIDHNQQFGDHVTANVGTRFNLSNDWTYNMSVANAFNAPSFNDLYWPFSGNPNLKPEESINGEVGFRHQSKYNQIEVNFFRNVITDLISWAPTSTGIWLPSNTDKTDIKGAELLYSTTIGNTSINSSATYLQPKNEKTGVDLIRRSRWNGSLALEQTINQYSAGIIIQGQSKKRGIEKLPGYALVDFHVSWTITPRFETRFVLENLFDKKYELVPGYNTQGVGAMLSFTYTPDN